MSKWVLHVGHSYNITTFKGGVFSRCKFIAETSRSWVALREGSPDWCEKSYLTDPKHYRYLVKLLPKKSEGIDWHLGTDRDAELAIWAAKHKGPITEKIRQYGFDNEILLTIARMIDYSPLQ